jgi:quinol monooxygenase YgiN
MRQVIVRYKVKPDRVEENEALVRAVYDELRRVAPAGLRYATFREPDGVSFVHVARHEDGPNPLAALESFQRFGAAIGARCDDPPVVTELDEVGSYDGLAS